MFITAAYTVMSFLSQYLEKSYFILSIKCSLVGIRGTAQVLNTKPLTKLKAVNISTTTRQQILLC